MKQPQDPRGASTGDPTVDATEALREHREALERLAESDLPVSPWARRLLAALDAAEGPSAGRQAVSDAVAADERGDGKGDE